MKFYFNQAGIWDGIVKGIEVFLWVAASGAVTGLIAYLSNFQVNQNDIVAVAFVAIANSALAGIQKWLSTKN